MSAVRFCPFCKEPFEGDVCPDHGLPLVTLVELASVARTPHEHDRLAAWDFRFGRRPLVVGALFVLVGMFAPAVVDGTRDDEITTLFELWQLRAGYLGIVPAAVVAVACLSFARRTRHDLLRARPALAVALVVACAALGVAGSKVVAYAQHLDAIGAESDLRAGYGLALVGAGLAAMFAGVVRLGRAPR